MKNNRIRCIRLGFFWICLLLCIYVYDLHFSRSVPQRDIRTDTLRFAGNSLRAAVATDKDEGGARGDDNKDIGVEDNDVPEMKEVGEEASLNDGQFSDEDQDVKLYEDVLELSKDGDRKSKVYFSDMKTTTTTLTTRRGRVNVTLADHRQPDEEPAAEINNISIERKDRLVRVEHPATAAPVKAGLTTPPTPYYKRFDREHWTISQLGTYNTSLFSPPPGEVPKRRFPKAIIIGAGKCGTRALLEFLTIHPYIVTANSEVHFFDLDENFKKGFLWYKSHMPLSFSNQITIEKTPSYIWSERAAHEIYKLNKNMKLILIVKDPVVRVISQAIRSSPENPEAMFIREHDGVLRIANESHTVDWGVYVKYIKMWLKVFPKSQLHIIESSQFITDPASEIQKLEQFLGIPHMITDKNFYYNQSKGFYCMRPFHTDAIICLSSGKGIPHPKINPIFEKLLYAYYSPHNEELFKLLGRKYDWRSKSE
ncbi:Heparan sulfate glucosamine 3-O-sulfotransferase 5 [Bulinus truncatus]|nr:Heparan sulfate glucosamine 3-O-sulfotransferase 5 [Bulinus truncatus]